MKSRKDRARDEHLGFAPPVSEPEAGEPTAVVDDDEDDGAYNDAWYRVLKARAGGETSES
jgi:hypothetical protein